MRRSPFGPGTGGDLRLAARLAVDLIRFLRTPLELTDCQRLLREGINAREDRLVDVIRTVFARPTNPYARLMRHAGIELGDATRLVREQGVEAALAQLYEAGVYVGLDEFNGRRPIVRSDLEITAEARDFGSSFIAGSGRKAAWRTPIALDLELLGHEAGQHGVFLDAFGLVDRPAALWALAGPAASGLKNVLRQAKLGLSFQHWFSPMPFRLQRGSTSAVLFTSYAIAAGRFAGTRLPRPEYVPFSEADRVARWLARTRAGGLPGALWTSVSAAVRVCVAAQEHGLDLTGTTFRVGGEPYTPAKAELISASGCNAMCHYSMHEVGKIGIACAAPVAPDDVHILSDKIATLQRPRHVGGNGEEVHALFHTTLLPSSPVLLLNVESGDEAVIGDRSCGCPFDELGFKAHAHTIRSYEKLTSEGNMFFGSSLLELLESVLPARFGGRPSDYQLIEHELAGLTRVTLLVSPSIGAVDEQAVLHTLRDWLTTRGRPERLMTEIWREAGTLRILRRDPVPSTSMKVLPLRKELGTSRRDGHHPLEQGR